MMGGLCRQMARSCSSDGRILTGQLVEHGVLRRERGRYWPPTDHAVAVGAVHQDRRGQLVAGWAVDPLRPGRTDPCGAPRRQWRPSDPDRRTRQRSGDRALSGLVAGRRMDRLLDELPGCGCAQPVRDAGGRERRASDHDGVARYAGARGRRRCTPTGGNRTCLCILEVWSLRSPIHP